MSSIRISDFQLRQQTDWGRLKEISQAAPGHSTAEPAFAEDCAQNILAVRKLFRDIVGLVLHTFAVIGKSWREQVITDGLTVQKHAVAAERGHIQARRLNGPRNLKHATKKRRVRLLQFWRRHLGRID